MAQTDPASIDTPRHVAIIMDGNGRWARRRHMPRFAGHRAGLEAVRKTIRACSEYGVEVLTLFAFSSENWRRPKEEVGLLMNLFLTALEREVEKLHANNIRLRIIGEVTGFSEELQQRIRAAEQLTCHNTALHLNIAANYGGRWDITEAVKRLSQQVLLGEISIEDITEKRVEQQLSTAQLPEPDLFIRTGGEQRISNFLLWQLAYTELYFTETLWPEFSVKELDLAIDSFGKRERRFGRTSEQVQEQSDA